VGVNPSGNIYLDYAATTPTDPDIAQDILDVMVHNFGNPSSKHACGRSAAEIVRWSREKVADLFQALPGQVVFTSGATESNNLALKGVAGSLGSDVAFITSCTEHKAVLEPMRQLETAGHRVEVLGVGCDGTINLGQLETLIKDCSVSHHNVLVSIMGVNNEIGSINPVEDIGKLCRELGAIYHCDATQMVGKVPFDPSCADLLSFSAHKIYGPKGIGVLINRWICLECQISGGSQEEGRRAGTCNVPGILGCALACDLAAERLDADASRADFLCQLFLREIEKNFSSGVFVHAGNARSPHILNFALEGVDSRMLLDSVPQLCISRSSACSKSDALSHVLAAVCTPEIAACSIRVSPGRGTSEDDMIAAANLLADGIEKLRMGS